MKPYYVYDLVHFANNVKEIDGEFKSVYKNFKIGYSYKTNSMPVFCKAAKKLGVMAEIVSPHEFELATKRDKVKYDNIIYNGLFDDFEHKVEVAAFGGIVNLDNIRQVLEMESLAQSRGVILDIGVRLNFSIGNGVHSRFGIDVNSTDYAELLRVKGRGHIRFKSVHCHFTRARSLKMFQNRICSMIMYSDELGASIIDIGGNMYGIMDEDFKAQYRGYIPTFREYAEVVAGAMKKRYADESKTLVIECGTPLVSNAMHLVAHIMNIKTIGGQVFIDIDAKREDVGAACSNADPTIIHYGKIENHVENAIICSCSCVEFDRIIRNYDGFANIGDAIMFKNIGAYSTCMANDFITPKIDAFMSISDFIISNQK